MDCSAYSTLGVQVAINHHNSAIADGGLMLVAAVALCPCPPQEAAMLYRPFSTVCMHITHMPSAAFAAALLLKLC